MLVDQFSRLRDGDSLWYQRIFHGRELRRIENTRLSDVIERNTDIVGLQQNVFLVPTDPAQDNLEPTLAMRDGATNAPPTRGDATKGLFTEGPAGRPMEQPAGPLAAQNARSDQRTDREAVRNRQQALTDRIFEDETFMIAPS